MGDWRVSSCSFISSSRLGRDEQQVLSCTKNTLSKKGQAPEELPTRAPGQARGLKKNLLKIEIREHPGTVWDLSRSRVSSAQQHLLPKFLSLLSQSHIVLPANFPGSPRQVAEDDSEPGELSREVIFNSGSGGGGHWRGREHHRVLGWGKAAALCE